MRTPLHFDSSGLVLGVVVAMAYFLLGAAWPLALGVGLLVFLLKVALDRPWRGYRRAVPAPEVGSPEAMWLDRAGRALISIKELRRSARSESIAQRCAAIAIQAEASVATLRRLAYQASVVSGLARSGARTDRLENTRLELQNRIESSVLGLEGLVARLAEIVALSEASPDVASVDDLAFELDTLRAAMVETEELGRTSVHSLTGSIEGGQ
jgi:hypothetical protein